MNTARTNSQSDGTKRRRRRRTKLGIGNFEVKIAIAVALAAVVPLAVGGLLINRVVDETLAVGLNEDIGRHLEHSTRVYPEFIRAKRELQDALALGLVSRIDALRASEPSGDDAHRRTVLADLQSFLDSNPDCEEATVLLPNGDALATATAVEVGAEYRSREVAFALGNGGTLRLKFVVLATYFEEFRYAEETLLPVYAELRNTQSRLRYFYTLLYVVILVVVLALSMTGALLFARSVTRRVLALVPATERVAEGDLDVEVPTESRDEIGALTRAFNRMVRQMRDSRERIEYLQKIGAWEEIARRLAHEVKNPLTPIQLAVQELHKKYPGGDSRFQHLLDEVVEVIEEEVKSLRALVDAFSDFARLPQASPMPDDLTSFVRDFVASCPRFREGLEVVFEDSETQTPVPAMIDRMMLRRAVLNLVKNAAEATVGEGRITLRIGGEMNRPCVAVCDAGPGIPVAETKRIFDPNFTTKAGGTGLGLAIVRRIMLEHHGEVTVQEGPDDGTEFHLHLQPGETDL